MKKLSFFQMLICVTFFGMALYSYIDTQHAAVEKRMLLPKLTKEVAAIKEENIRLSYQIDRFEDPKNLMALSRSYRHLKQPACEDVIVCSQGSALSVPTTHSFEEPAPSMIAKAH